MDGIGIRYRATNEQASAEHDKLRAALFNLRKCIRARTGPENLMIRATGHDRRKKS